ncbi:caspase family protein [Streptomyces angustmyceticus]|uniref:caspase family protein n=1 Tax=Streptomyces angustmyceticus TaxID=285578 RepID=UPI00382EF6DB
MAHHQRSPEGDRPGLIEAREKIIALFTQRLGYTHVSDLGLDPDRNSLLQHLDRFATDPDRRPDDIVAVYLAGHGQLIGSTPRRHMFFPADADLAKPKLALPTAQIAAALTDDTKITQLLLILDTCHSSQGGSDFISAALESLRRSIDDDPSGIAVIASAQPAQQAIEGAFPSLLAAAVESRATAGERPSTLDLGALVTHMNADPAKPPTQRIEWDAAKLTGALPDFFPNPRHAAGPHEVDLAIQHAAEWDAQAQRRDTEFTRRMLIRAMGHIGDTEQWWFTGRHEVMSDITDWLARPGPGRAGLVVTAGPGSGKTAVLGLAAALCHPEQRNTVPLHLLALESHQLPEPGSVDVAIYAQALTNDEVLRGLAAAARTAATVPGDLVDALAGRARPLTVIIDALDEAATPDTLLTQLIRPLLEHGQGRVRMLLGTRPHLLRHLSTDTSVINLDDPAHLDRRAIAAYALRGLLESVPGTPYLHVAPRLSAEVAEAVAEAAVPSFLVARIVSSTLAAESSVADPSDHAWRASLPRTAETAMARDLDTRLGHHAVRARDLLRALAYAEGQGLPWEDIWGPLASRISGRAYGNDDQLWLKRNAGSYVVEATEDGRSVYRLYHIALAEHLRRGHDDEAVQKAFVDVLLGGVPRSIAGRRDWSRAHPYTLRHLAIHAMHVGRVDELLDDCEYLALAAPHQLLQALQEVVTSRGRQLRAIYRTSAGHHAGLDPADRRSVLAVDAMRHGHRSLAYALSPDEPWQVRWASGVQISAALRATLVGHTGWVMAMGFTSVDGTPVAVTGGASGDMTVRVWDLDTNSERHVLTGHHHVIDAVACSEVDGVPVAVSSSRDGSVRVWDLRAGSERDVLQEPSDQQWPTYVTAIACTTLDGAPLAVMGYTDGTVQVWDLATATQRRTLHGRAFIESVACTFVNGSPVAAVGGRGNVIDVWDLASGVKKYEFDTGGWCPSIDCAFVDGRPVVVAAGPKLSFWDLSGSNRHQYLTENQAPGMQHMATAVVGKVPVAICGESSGRVRIWDLDRHTQPRVLAGHTRNVYAVACGEVGGKPVAITSGYDQEVRVWDLSHAPIDDPTAGHSSAIQTMTCVNTDEQSVAITGCGDGKVLVWNLSTGNVQASMDAHRLGVLSMSHGEWDGRPVVVTSGGGSDMIRFWDHERGVELNAIDVEPDNVCPLSYTVLGGRPTAVMGIGSRLAALDLATDSVEVVLGDQPGTHIDGLASVVRSEGPIIVVGRNRYANGYAQSGEVRIWNEVAGVERNLCEEPIAPVTHVAATLLLGSPYAVSSHADGALCVWELESGIRYRTLFVENGRPSVSCLGVLNGVMVIASARGNEVQIWDLESTTKRQNWTFPYGVAEMAFGSSGELVVATGHEVVVLESKSTC